jgi:hypothetical protein
MSFCACLDGLTIWCAIFVSCAVMCNSYSPSQLFCSFKYLLVCLLMSNAQLCLAMNRFQLYNPHRYF